MLIENSANYFIHLHLNCFRENISGFCDFIICVSCFIPSLSGDVFLFCHLGLTIFFIYLLVVSLLFITVLLMHLPLRFQYMWPSSTHLTQMKSNQTLHPPMRDQDHICSAVTCLAHHTTVHL